MDALTPYLLVFVGAGLGGMLRHGLNVVVARMMGASFPWATMFINITGSMLMGLLVGWLSQRGASAWALSTRIFVATGILGGYTTFSTFSLDTIALLERQQIGAALAYAGGSVVIGIVGLWGGLSLARSWS